MPALKSIFLALGVVCAVVGVIAGVLFALSEELALGQVSCVAGPLSDANATNCKDGKVLSATGGECVIGNLGIFNAKYDPACTAGTPYAITAPIPVYEGPTANFPLLFPSQTNLAGIPGAPAFTNCDSYFDASVTGFAVAATDGGLTAGIESFKQAVKDGYDAQIASIIPTLNATLAALPIVLLTGIEEGTGQTFPANYDDIMIAPSTTALAFLTSISGGSAVAALVEGAINLAILSGFNSTTNLVATINAGFLVGATTQFQTANALFIPDTGSFWANVDSTVLCGIIPTPCSMIDILAGAAPLLGDASLDSAVAVVVGYETALGGRAVLEANVGLANPLGDATISTNFVTNVQGNLADSSAVEPADIFAVESPLTTLGQVFFAGCGVACNFVDFLQNSTSSASTAAEERGLLTILGTLQQCAPGPISSAACIDGVLATAPGQVTALTAVLGALYGLEDASTFASVAEVQTALTASCKNHEADLAAIQTAAIVIPTGVGLLGVGTIAAVAAVALGNKKVVGVVGALVAIVGMALVLGGLLGVFFAPVYSSIGGSSPEDNSIGFGLGIGFTYIALLAGAGIIGALLLLVGALLKKPEDASVAIMKP